MFKVTVRKEIGSKYIIKYKYAEYVQVNNKDVETTSVDVTRRSLI